MQSDFKNIKRIVIKIGSSLLVEEGRLRKNWLEKFAYDVAQLLAKNIEIVIVSSGAVALGRRAFNEKGKLSLQQKQAAAAIGQIELMSGWQDAGKKHNFAVAQILLTALDCNERERYNNSQNTIASLLARKIVPVINENDSVAVDEIKIGDNDRLAARVAQMISADLLILFSDIDGLYNKNPKIARDAKLIAEVKKITKEIEEMAGGVTSAVGTGGMITKIIAAKMATMSGCETVISNGLVLGAVEKLFSAKQNYTIFRSDKNALKLRKKLLSGFMNAKGEVVINDRAVEAFATKKISLLPIGINKVFGDFKQGDLIFIKDENGNHIASGIANYEATMAVKIMGTNSKQAKKILGRAKTELVHIDNLVVM